jgi:hypothetical protein
MSIELPEILSAYFAADREGNPEAVSRCFTEAATVKDERRIYTGRDAIRRWKSEASTKYNYTVEPFAIESDGGRTVVKSHLAGDFPGSPLDLRYLFRLQGDKIEELEITP